MSGSVANSLLYDDCDDDGFVVCGGGEDILVCSVAAGADAGAGAAAGAGAGVGGAVKTVVAASCWDAGPDSGAPLPPPLPAGRYDATVRSSLSRSIGLVR